MSVYLTCFSIRTPKHGRLHRNWTGKGPGPKGETKQINVLVDIRSSRQGYLETVMKDRESMHICLEASQHFRT